MAVPDYHEFMLPLLRLASDRQGHRLRDTVDVMADEFRVCGTDREVLLPSAREAVLLNG